MEAYQERVVLEKKELDEKISKLEPFMVSQLFEKLSTNDQYLLNKQHLAMKEYSTILSLRIQRFV